MASTTGVAQPDLNRAGVDGERRAQIDRDLAGIVSLFDDAEPLYCLCSGPYTTSMIACRTCCNHYHTSCLDRYQCRYEPATSFTCPLCDQSLTMKRIAVLDEKLYREAQARTRASKRSRSSSRPADLDIDSDEIVLSDDVVPIEATRPRPASSGTAKKSKSKKAAASKDRSS